MKYPKFLFIVACVFCSTIATAKSLMVQINMKGNPPVVDKVWVVERKAKELTKPAKAASYLEVNAIDARGRILWTKQIDDIRPEHSGELHADGDEVAPNHHLLRLPLSKRVDQVVIRRILANGQYDPQTVNPVFVIQPPNN